MQFDRIISVRNDRTVFRDGSTCIKVSSEDYPASAILSEAMNMAAAAEAGLSVPKLHEVNVFEKNRLITYEYIAGGPIGCCDKDSPDFRTERLNLLINAQLAVNGASCPECIRRPSTAAGFGIDFPARNEHEQADEFELVQNAFNGGRKAAFAGNALCHGNLAPENVILTPEGKLYVIDWAYAYPGVPESDAAICFLKLLLTCGERTAREYLELYFKRACPHSLDAVTALLPFAASMLYNREKAAGRKLLLSIIKKYQ